MNLGRIVAHSNYIDGGEYKSNRFDVMAETDRMGGSIYCGVMVEVDIVSG